ncbi:MAG TPA: HAMP domain-containing sensor histidine kinase [Cyclobacteriaceae bacterium]|nr:HAMP domain-containing sensor histidine kinase [Cyclobacteriaceae bacterium]
MSIRNKILLYFSVVTIALVGAALFFIYTLFAQFREQEFQQLQKDKINTTLKFLTEFKEINQNLIEAMDRITIHDLYDEKLLIFDRSKNLVYTSIDDTPISFSHKILEELSVHNTLVEQKDGLYDVVGLYLEKDEKAYYGISKAYDISGYSKLNYLKYVFSLTFVAISLVVVLVSYYLSKRITHSIAHVTRQIKDFNFNERGNPIITTTSRDEISLLVQRFNELMGRMNEAFAFQKHAVHHISHELKTPIAVLVSDFEKIEKETDANRIRSLIEIQKENTKSLGEVINSLLEIAKAESGSSPSQSNIRVDEMIFDLAEEFSVIHPDFQFSVDYSQNVVNEGGLTISANLRLMKAALSNLMLNCVQYSYDHRARVIITPGGENLQIDFSNQGAVLSEREQQFLFQHFFRGENSKGKRGFGLGLVFINKIMGLYGGKVSYHTNNIDVNVFTISLPLS